MVHEVYDAALRFSRDAVTARGAHQRTDRSPALPSPNADPGYPFERANFLRQQRLGNNGTLASLAFLKADQHREKMISSRGGVADAGIDSTAWTWMGPGNIGGRVLAITIHPDRTDEMLVGSASGGVWKTTDGGANWRPIDDFLGSLAVSTIALAPADPEIVYAGTGELNSALGSIRGAGVYKSTDFGESWIPLPETMEPAAAGRWTYVNRLAVHPTNPNIVLAGTTPGGIFRTINGGTNWTNELSSNWIGDIQFDPTDGNKAVASDCCTAMTGAFNPNVFYFDAAAPGAPSWRRATFSAALGSATLISTSECEAGSGLRDKLVVDSTADFREGDNVRIGSIGPVALARILSPTEMCLRVGIAVPTPGATVAIVPGGRVELAYAPSDPTIVFLAMNSGGDSLWQSTDGGQSYAPVAKRLGYMWGQGNYNNAIWVDPTDSDHIVLGGGHMIATFDGGMNFRDAGEGGHADRHWLVEHPDFDGSSIKKLFICSDGGVEFVEDIYALGVDDKMRIQKLNNGLGITQFIHADADSSTGQILGGTQDNGSILYTPSEGTSGWQTFAGGDGGFSWIDPSDPEWLYSEYVKARVFRGHPGIRYNGYIHGPNVDRNGNCCATDELDEGSNCVALGDPPPGSLADACTGAADFYAPTLLDPNHPQRLYVGAARLWRTEDARAESVTWTAIKPRAGYCNRASDNAGDPCGDDADCPNGACGFSNISALDIPDGSPNTVWACHGNGMVFRTTNGLSASPTWTRVNDNEPDDDDPFTGPLPKRWCTELRVDPNDINRVYVTIGGNEADTIWRSDDAGMSWRMISGGLSCDLLARPATALPCIQVNDLEVHPSQPGWLYAATDLGIYTSENDGVTWSAVNDGPANVLVFEIAFGDDDRLFAITHGRGVFRTAPIVPDCDGNAIADRVEISARDCNENERIDVCDINSAESPDCNGNDTPDECEISSASSAPGGPYFCVLDCRPDCDNNGVPDECDPDCNTNGQPDACDLDSGLTFVRSRSKAAGLAPSSLAAADFNGDGFDDLAVANWESSDISILINLGLDASDDWLGFDDAVNYNTREVPAIPWVVTTGDFDKDGDVDVAYVAESGDIFRLFSDLGVLLNNGDGTFNWSGFLPIEIENVGSFRSEGLAAADLNDDTFLDLIVGSTRSAGGIGGVQLTLIFNLGLNTSGEWHGFDPPLGVDRFPGVGQGPKSIGVGRFNSDGFLDIAVANEVSGDVSVLINDGTGVFGPDTTYAVGGAPSSIAVGPLNDDDFDDLAVVNVVSPQVFLLMANGDGSFTAPAGVAAGLANPITIALGDFDREGSMDLAIGSDSTLRPMILLNNGFGTFGAPFPVEVSAPAVSAAALDVDRDRDFDLATVGGGERSPVFVAINDTTIDCNRNDVPDDCEIDAGRPDRDNDDLLDECEVGRCDVDGDGDCDLGDYRRMHDCWRGPGVPCGAIAGAGGPAVDLDGDFDFDLRDFAIFQRSFTDPRDCCGAHGPGCIDYAIESCVCAVRPECCTTAWTAECVGAIDALGCGTCAGQRPCGDGSCSGDENCVTCPVDCESCAGECCAAHEGLGCEDPATVDCVCSLEPRCCVEGWAAECAGIAAAQCGACCGDGVCNDGEGCERCPIDCFRECPPACGNTFCQPGETCLNCEADCGVCPEICGDGTCIPSETCGTCVEDCGACDGACCLANDSIGCQNPAVQACVCSFNPDCCTVVWSESCALDARQCGGCNNDCCAPANGPGCFDLEITACVCGERPSCCTQAWDVVCAEIAASTCAACCGNQMCEPGETCAGCAQDCGVCPSACGNGNCEFDETCATCAQDCGACSGSCCLPQTGPGCADPAVYACVCQFDSYCCTDQWDSICAIETEQCNTCAGDCCEPNGTPGCNNLQVELCVCGQDPYCCNTDWDDQCAEEVTTRQCGDCPANQPPQVSVTEPPQDTGTSDINFVYDGFDQQLGLWYADATLKASADDPEDGPLTGSSLEWTTDRADLQPGGNAMLGTGTELTVRLYSNVAAPGGVWHEITVTATDSQGASASATRRVYIWGFG